MEKITRERFENLVGTKIYNNKWDAFITWNRLDMFQLADSEQQAKDNLFRRINTGWQDSEPNNQEQD